MPEARGGPGRSADGSFGLAPAPSPSSSAAADWGGDSSPGDNASERSTATDASPEASTAAPSCSSPGLARALAALDLRLSGGDDAFAGLADALAEWDAALQGVDGNSPGSAAGSLLDVDGEWDGAVSPPLQAE